MRRLVLLLLLMLATAAHAQQTAPVTQNADAPSGGEHLRVYLVTYGPGDEFWEKFGHNAIWIEDEALGYGVAYNWGMFSFRQPHFLARFLKGDMLYWMAGFDALQFNSIYTQENRSIWVQELNLTPAQRADLAHFVDWNSREENKYYRYDYYRDNCSTRVRDAIDRATGGALRRTLVPLPTRSTYRSHTQALTYDQPPLYTGLMIAMGPRIDQPLNAWQESFIPMELREWVRKVKVRAADGSEQPLVVNERTLYEAHDRAPVAQRAPSMILIYTAVGFIIGGLLLLIWVASRKYPLVKPLLATLVGLWCFVVGLVGTLMELLWAFTHHVVTYNNENVLQANSTSLVLALFAVAAILGFAWARRWAAWLALFVAGCSVLGFLLQVLPNFNQVNGEIIGLFMPVHGAVAYMLWRRWAVNDVPTLPT